MWSKTKKHLKSFWANSVTKRFDINCIMYRKAHDHYGRVCFLIDKKEIIKMCHYSFEEIYWPLQKELSPLSYKEVYKMLYQGNIFGSQYFFDSIQDYFDSPINKIIKSPNIITRALGMLDKRLGKRTLEKIDVSHEHELIQRLYALRCDCEGIKSYDSKDLTKKILPIFPKN